MSMETDTRFQESLLCLLEDNPIYKISVTDLTKQAGLSRTFFYRQYDDIYEVYDAICQDVLEPLVKIVESKPEKSIDVNPIDDKIRQCMMYIAEQEKVMSILLSSDDNLYFHHQLKRLFVKILKDHDSHSHPDYIYDIFVVSLVELVDVAFENHLALDSPEVNSMFAIWVKPFLQQEYLC